MTDDSNAPGIAAPLHNPWQCVYCGRIHESENGTGGDVACCGEIGHVEPITYEDSDNGF